MRTKEDKFYKSNKWVALRNTALIRDKYMCQCCKANNRYTNASCVHHIFPKDSYPQYSYELWNLMSLCDKCHDEMHNHYTGELSKKGMLFLRSIAAVKGINISCKEQTILVVGLRGTGKTTYCKTMMDEYSLCYDLDMIAKAFRLNNPGEEYFKPARRMANDFLKGFVIKAHEYAKKIFIIRTAPTIKEFEEIAPDKIVFCMHQYVFKEMDDRPKAIERLSELQKYCAGKDVEVETIEAPRLYGGG